jgi:hypothetical protein
MVGLFLTFAAFALDLGNMYLWQLRLDKAARAGVLAGLGARGLSGYSNVAAQGGQQLMNTPATTAVTENLLYYTSPTQAGTLPTGFSIPAPVWNQNTDQYSLTVRYTMPTILIGRLSNILGWGFTTGNATSINISSMKTAQLSRANVVLMLDVSGSMLCPVVDPQGFTSPPCACRRSADPNACGSGATKLQMMAQGVVNFVSRFNPNRDRISVIPFNLAARRLFSFTTYKNNGSHSTLNATPNTLTLGQAIPIPGNGTPAIPASTTLWELLTNQANLTNALTTLAGSNTNHCDALAEGIRELETLSQDVLGTGGPEADRRKLQPFVVFFTDGAPNAMRGIFPDTTVTPGGDFYHYALEWVAPNNKAPTQPFIYRGPAPFVLRTADASAPSTVQPLFRFPIAANAIAPTGSTQCGTQKANFFEFEQTITQNTTTARGGPQGCLNQTAATFNFSIPYTNVNRSGQQTQNFEAGVRNVPFSSSTTIWRDPNWPPTVGNVGPYGVQKYDELPYYCAVEAADFLRLQFGATIFAIGLGPTKAHFVNSNINNPTHSNCSDPLMDADDHSGRKDFFLARLAFARQIFDKPVFPTSIMPHYQINMPQMNRRVIRCAQHRLRAPDSLQELLWPQVRIGYTSPTTLDSLPNSLKQDNILSAFKVLRPFRPLAIDSNNTGTQNYRRIDTVGEYFPTNNPNEVPSIFSNIAKTILLRSTS